MFLGVIEMKKPFIKPELIVYGSIEKMTQVSMKDVEKVGKFISLIGKSGKLLSIISF